MGKITQKYIENDSYLYITHKNDGLRCLQLNENNIDDINFVNNYINYNDKITNNCLNNNNILPCYNYSKQELKVYYIM